MTAPGTLRLTLALAFLALLLAPGCSRSGGSQEKLLSHWDLSGHWAGTSEADSDECAPVLQLPLLNGVFTLRQSGDALNLSQLSCLIFLTDILPPPPGLSGSGTREDRLFTLTLGRTIPLGPTCAVQVTEVVAGSVEVGLLTGQAALSATATGDCGAGFPCRVEGRFTLAPCDADHCLDLVCRE